MFKLMTDPLELRGVQNKKSKNGNVYYNLNCENIADGEPYQFYCPSADVLPEGLKKGDKIKVVVTYNKFKNLIVSDVMKVG